jgi:hypothetical protein
VNIRPFNRSAHARNIGSVLSRSIYRLDIHGSHNVAKDGSLILLTAGVGVSGLMLIKSIVRRPVHLLIPHPSAHISGDIPVILPFAIEGQLLALEALRQDAAIALDTKIIEPGFLINSTGASVIPISIWMENRHTGKIEPWQGAPPPLRSRVHVYFGQCERHEVVNSLALGISRVNQFAAEWSRQLIQDHQQMVLRRLGGGQHGE